MVFIIFLWGVFFWDLVDFFMGIFVKHSKILEPSGMVLWGWVVVVDKRERIWGSERLVW